MQQIFDELTNLEKTLKEHSAKLNKILRQIPNFEEYKNNITGQIIGIEHIINKPFTQNRSHYLDKLIKLRSLKLEDSFSNLIKERNPYLIRSKYFYSPLLPQYYEIMRNFFNIKEKFCEELITKKIQDNFLKVNLLKVIEIISPKMRDKEYAIKILEIIPKPSEEEYCRDYIYIAQLSKKMIYDGEIRYTPDEKELMKIFKKRYQFFVHNIIEIRDFYQIEQFRAKQKESKAFQTNSVRKTLRDYFNSGLHHPLSEEELEIEVETHFKEMQKQELISYIIKNRLDDFYYKFQFEEFMMSLPNDNETCYIENDSYSNETDYRISQERFPNIYDSDLNDGERFIEDNCL